MCPECAGIGKKTVINKEAVRRPTDFYIPLGVLCVITGVAGSGKSSLISGVFAAEYEDRIIHVDQSAIMATNRSMPATFLGMEEKDRD